MQQARLTEEQIIAELKENDVVAKTADLARRASSASSNFSGVPSATLSLQLKVKIHFGQNRLTFILQNSV